MPPDNEQGQAGHGEDTQGIKRRSSSSTSSTSSGYPSIIPPSSSSTFLHPPPLAARLFPHPDDSQLTSSNKLVSLTTGLAFTLASARGALAAVLTHGGGRRLAFRQGFATTFPIYFTAFLLGAFVDHAFNRKGGDGVRRRTYEYDLP